MESESDLKLYMDRFDGPGWATPSSEAFGNERFIGNIWAIEPSDVSSPLRDED